MDKIKSLWAYIDADLSFDAQVNIVCRTCNKQIRALTQIWNNLPMDFAKMVACSRPGLVWITATHSYTASLTRTYRNCSESRTISFMSFWRHLVRLQPSKCFQFCTGCQSSTASGTRWQYLRTNRWGSYRLHICLSCCTVTLRWDKHDRPRQIYWLSPQCVPRLDLELSVMRHHLSGIVCQRISRRSIP